MRHQRNRIPFVTTVALLALLQMPLAPALVQAAEKINVRGGVHDNSNRLVFDFQRTPKYDFKQDGDIITLTFTGEMDFTRGASAKKLSRLTDFESREDGGKSIVTFRVAPNAKVDHFLSGTYVAVDVKGAIPAATANKPAEAPAVTAIKELDALTNKTSGPKIIVGDPVPTVTATTAPVSLTQQTILGTLDLPANLQQVPAAIFQRGADAYIIFDRRIKFKAAPNVPAPTVIDGGAFTGYRLSNPQNNARLGIVLNNKQWQLVLNDNATTDSQAVAPRVEPYYALGARVMMPITSVGPTGAYAPQIVSFIDPVVGDTLFVAPVTGRQGVDRARRFVEFDLLPSDQGVVVRPLNDKLTLRSMESGIEIAVPGGMRLTDPEKVVAAPPKEVVELPTLPAPVEEPVIPPALVAEQYKLFFDLPNWKQGKAETFDAARRRLQDIISNQPREARNKTRFELARLYLANGYGKETRGVLALMASEEEGGLEDLAGQPEYKGLMAAAEMLSGNQNLAQPVFSSTTFGEYDDIKLWQAASLAESHDFAGAAPLFDATTDILKSYPQPLYQRFALLATETYMALGNYPKATSMIDQFAARNKSALRLPQVLYLRGVLQSRTGTFDAARKLWEETAKSDDQLASVRARFATIDMNLVSKSITPDEAAEQLERLRYGWRGDDLELQILNRLADIYSTNSRPEEALKTLDRAKAIFPEPGRDAEATDKQRKIFKEFFMGEQLDKIQPLKVLSLYNKYKDYAPTDPAESRIITGRLVERMLAMDLLPQAASLLSQRLTDELDPLIKAKVGAQLAGIRLLNQQPDEALKALAGSEATYETESATERKFLKARALADTRKYDDALALLEGDTSETALRLAATTAWQAKQWAKAASALNALLPAPPAGKMTDEQAQIIVNRAVALSLAGDQAGLNKLVNDFGGAMRATPLADTFALLTNPDKAAGNLSALGAQTKGVDLFKSFLESYRK